MAGLEPARNVRLDENAVFDRTLTQRHLGANIEAGDTNRVTVQLDDQTPSVQQWLRTDTYQELFAPDGLTLARQLVGASLMRFTFTPFGSRPVVAEFNVGGFDQHVATVARTCGWPGAAGTSARKR